MPKHRLTALVRELPSSIPFVGPEALERQLGQRFVARIGANESAFGLSMQAEQALQEAIARKDCSWYPDPESRELREALANKHHVDAEEICVDAGIDTLLGLTVRMLVEPGADVVTSLGAYPTFNYHVNGFGARLHTVPYRDNHEDVIALRDKAASTRASLLYLSNPDNPMGTRIDKASVNALIDSLPEPCTLALDEAYSDFDVDEQLVPIDTTNANVIRFRTFSKAYGMAGLRIGYAIAHRELIAGMNRIRNHFGLSRLAQIAALASVRDADMLPRVRREVEDGRLRIVDLAAELGLRAVQSHTNFVAVDVGSGERARQLLASMQERGVFLRMPGVAPLDRHLRIGVGTPDEHAIFATHFRELLAR